ncbi:MAG: hypothetical protein ACHQAY_07300 [Hyphomicrobiales bacterium]
MSNDDSEARSWAQDFLFGASLYSEDDVESRAYALLVEPFIVDGHCPYCQRNETFHRSSRQADIMSYTDLIDDYPSWEFEIACTRDRTHKIIFFFRFHRNRIQKIGQFPSLADIANDESRLYGQVLEPADAADLHRAIGLSAHGVGVGSFVYLRRVFERLISRRFTEFKEKEGWKDSEFVGKRMDDKIELLKRHLPAFLIRNSRIYAILSKGIHELGEDECLNAFDFLKQSLFFVLDEDKRKKEELEGRRRVEQAIASFSGGGEAPQ